MTTEERLDKQKYVIDKEAGIATFNEAFYIEAIIYSAGRAEDAFKRLNESLLNSSDAATMVAIAHEALTHVAGLSRFFWPARDKDPLHKARGEKLRKAFDLDNTSPLHDRDLRNALEHFDEKLDHFLLEDHAGHFYPSPVVGSISLSETPFSSMFRLLDPKEDVFVLLGKNYSFGAVRGTANDILNKAKRMNEQGGRLV